MAISKSGNYIERKVQATMSDVSNHFESDIAGNHHQ